ncbi:toxin-antitoxin system YwqK family antitoxin [Larkinella terrae]|nr:toxin-antitoxin system YwqK family antitoxin [Larkinella terrae]
MAIMARRAAGRSKLLGLLAGLCLSCQPSPETIIFLDAATVRIQTREGITYAGGKPISGVLFEKDSQGDTTFRVSFLDGKEDGVARFFYPGNRLREERFFVNGWKEGVHRGWYENGRRRFEYHFQNDLFDGSYQEWFPNGKPFRNMHYEKGQESGVQQIWYSSGKIKTNYLIKDDRRYGLLGTKNCRNVADSVFRK